MAGSDEPTSGTLAVPDVVLFTVGPHPVLAADLVARARADGTWDRVTALSRRLVGAETADQDRERLTVAEREFRYARGLVAAEDVERWLSTFALSVAEWRTYLRRELASRDRSAGPGTADERTEWVVACCSGLLGEIAETWAQRMAASLAQDQPVDTAAADVVDRFLTVAVDDAAVDRELADNPVDWLHVRYAVVSAPNLDAAAEARLCLAVDGMRPEEVAALIGGPVSTHEHRLGDAPPELLQPLLTTTVGDVSRPLPRDVGADVVALYERLPADVTDTATRQRVREVLSRRQLDRLVEDRVRWHVTF